MKDQFSASSLAVMTNKEIVWGVLPLSAVPSKVMSFGPVNAGLGLVLFCFQQRQYKCLMACFVLTS